MILAKEIDGELWVKASDHHRLIKDAQRTWVGLSEEELREFDVDPIEAKLMIAKLKEKNNG